MLDLDTQRAREPTSPAPNKAQTGFLSNPNNRHPGIKSAEDSNGAKLGVRRDFKRKGAENQDKSAMAAPLATKSCRGPNRRSGSCKAKDSARIVGKYPLDPVLRLPGDWVFVLQDQLGQTSFLGLASE
jgi:hypothetical protein